MAGYLIQDSTLTGIADAIRAKDGSSAPILTEDMADAIAAIPSSEGEVWELHEITGIVLTSGTLPTTLLNRYISKCAQWCYFPTSESPSINSVARGNTFQKGDPAVIGSNLLGSTGSAAGNTATTSVPLPTQCYVNDQTVSSTRSRGNVNQIPAGTYTLKFYGVAI